MAEYMTEELKELLPQYLEMPVTKVSSLQPAVKVVEIEDYTEYIAMCHKRVTETKCFEERGLSNEIVERFCLGYDPNKNLVTIPYNPGSKGYIHRIMFHGNNKYVKHGETEIFNVKALYDNDTVFVTEGQMDCMSFEEIG